MKKKLKLVKVPAVHLREDNKEISANEIFKTQKFVQLKLIEQPSAEEALFSRVDLSPIHEKEEKDSIDYVSFDKTKLFSDEFLNFIELKPPETLVFDKSMEFFPVVQPKSQANVFLLEAPLEELKEYMRFPTPVTTPCVTKRSAQKKNLIEVILRANGLRLFSEDLLFLPVNCNHSENPQTEHELIFLSSEEISLTSDIYDNKCEDLFRYANCLCSDHRLETLCGTYVSRILKDAFFECFMECSPCDVWKELKASSGNLVKVLNNLREDSQKQILKITCFVWGLIASENCSMPTRKCKSLILAYLSGIQLTEDHLLAQFISTIRSLCHLRFRVVLNQSHVRVFEILSGEMFEDVDIIETELSKHISLEISAEEAVLVPEDMFSVKEFLESVAAGFLNKYKKLHLVFLEDFDEEKVAEVQISLSFFNQSIDNARVEFHLSKYFETLLRQLILKGDKKEHNTAHRVSLHLSDCHCREVWIESFKNNKECPLKSHFLYQFPSLSFTRAIQLLESSTSLAKILLPGNEILSKGDQEFASLTADYVKQLRKRRLVLSSAPPRTRRFRSRGRLRQTTLAWT
eukprot:augustus_masked-scaffold_8-processed-gene-1.2-mRNA-1 protein AED:1.00 eAED:1.00 QI:0/-1/0/0/-1/1/1/0/574